MYLPSMQHAIVNHNYIGMETSLTHGISPFPSLFTNHVCLGEQLFGWLFCVVSQPIFRHPKIPWPFFIKPWGSSVGFCHPWRMGLESSMKSVSLVLFLIWFSLTSSSAGQERFEAEPRLVRLERTGNRGWELQSINLVATNGNVH